MLSRFNVTVSVAPTTDDIPVPPAISSVSPPATVWFEPLSPVSVNDVLIAAVVAFVIRPCWSIVSTGIAVVVP